MHPLNLEFAQNLLYDLVMNKEFFDYVQSHIPEIRDYIIPYFEDHKDEIGKALIMHCLVAVFGTILPTQYKLMGDMFVECGKPYGSQRLSEWLYAFSARRHTYDGDRMRFTYSRETWSLVVVVENIALAQAIKSYVESVTAIRISDRDLDLCVKNDWFYDLYRDVLMPRFSGSLCKYLEFTGYDLLTSEYLKIARSIQILQESGQFSFGAYYDDYNLAISEAYDLAASMNQSLVVI